MTEYNATIEKYHIIHNNNVTGSVYPLLRSMDKCDAKMYLVSPLHGRSYLVGKTHDRCIISKGNGLSYSTHIFVNTLELGADSWGLLLKQDATRDFIVGNEISTLGIKTNHMEYVLEIQKAVRFENGLQLKPALLQ